MFTFKELFEAKDAGGHGSEKHHVMSFARMNPPTTGHMEVVSKLHAVAKEHNAPHSLIVSGSHDAKKNPLTAEQKVKHLKRYSPETNVKAADKESPTILHHAAALHKSGVQHLHVVAGSDRHKEMHDLLHKYNTGEEHKHGSFKFKSITMHSSGERDPDSEGTTGMSGTKMRQHAHDNNFAEFRKGVPSHVSDKHAHELMNDVRKGSGIKEEAISYKTFMEARMSAAVKLQRAFEREQQKSAASRERAKELLAPKKPEPVKEETIDETIVKVDSGYEVHSENGKNLGGSPTLAGAKKRLKQVEYFKHMKEEEMQFTESVHDNRTGFAKKKREDDEGGELYRHTYKFHVSKPGVNDGKKHERHVTTPLTPRKKGDIEHLARAHLTKQGYQIHEGEERGAYKQKSPVVIAPKDPKAKTYGKIVSKIRTMGEEVELDESMTDSWKKVQSMDKGSVTGGKEQVKKHLDYLTAVHAHHKKFGNDTLKVRKKIEGIKRSHIAEEAEQIDEISDDAKAKYIKAVRKSVTHLDNTAHQHRQAGDEKTADKFNAKRDQRSVRANQTYSNMSASAKKKANEEVEQIGEGATGAKPGWMLRQDPVLAKKVKDSKRGYQALKKWAGKPIDKNVKEETQETEMGLKSFSTLVKEGTLQSSGDDSIPTLTDVPAKKVEEQAPVAPTLDRKYIKGTQEHKAYKATKKPINGIPTGKYNEEVEALDEKSEQARQNKTMKNMMDASRGARFKLNNPVPDAGPEHKTGQAHNKAIGRALRKEDAELEEAKHVAPTNTKPAVDIDKVNAAGQEPHHETFEDHKKVKKESFSVADLFQALKEGMWPGTPEYKAKYDGAKQGGGAGVKKGSRYGGSLQKDEPDHDEDDTPAKAGRKVGSKSGARKNLGNSKLHK